MSNVRIGIQTRSLRQPLRQALHTASMLGADGVEIDVRSELPVGQLSTTGLRDFHKLLGDLNLRVCAAAFPTRRGYDVADDLERRVAATQAAMRFARDLRADVVVNRVGVFPADASDSARTRMIEALTAIGAYGERFGTRLAAQTIGDGPQSLAHLVEELPEHTLGIALHPSGLIAGGFTTFDALEVFGQHVIYVYACDAIREPGGGSREVELGRGSAEVPELLGQLSAYDYRGWVTIERRESGNPRQDIENAIAYLRAL